jgi:hypothetical protein
VRGLVAAVAVTLLVMGCQCRAVPQAPFMQCQTCAAVATAVVDVQASNAHVHTFKTYCTIMSRPVTQPD